MKTKRLAVVLFGPTAAGKTAASLRLAAAVGGEIINADSRQLYQDMPIITAMPTAAERAVVPHHLFEVLPPLADFSVNDWLQQVHQIAAGIWARGGVPFIVGGTGFYLDVLMRGISPVPATDSALLADLEAAYSQEGWAAMLARLRAVDATAAAQLKAGDKQRLLRALAVYEGTGRPLSSWQQIPREGALPAQFLKLAVCPPRPVLYQRITDRYTDMLAQGLLAELEGLYKNYQTYLDDPARTLPGALSSIGLPEFAAYFKGEKSLEDVNAITLQKMRNYAKRQTTWLRHNYVADILAETGDDPQLDAAVEAFVCP